MSANGNKTTIPEVPIQTPMFEEDAASGGGMNKHLTRTWIIFFERIRKAALAIQNTGNDVDEFGCWIGWDIQDPTVGSDVSDPVIPPVAYVPSQCKIRVKASDIAGPFQIDIRKNGISIFDILPLVAAGASSRAVHLFTNIKANTQIAVDDDVVIDILQGGGNWQVAVYLIGDPL